MKKVLLSVEDSKGSLNVINTFSELFSSSRPETIVLLYVEKIEGRSLMDEMLGNAEMSTLKEQLKGTEFQKLLDRKAEKILAYFKKILEDKGITGIKTVVKEGHPADEILETAKEESANMIIVGSRAKKMHTLFMGSVSREVANRAEIPVLIAK
jgi:nucleotide-binding universal stress UspA family protein